MFRNFRIFLTSHFILEVEGFAGAFIGLWGIGGGGGAAILYTIILAWLVCALFCNKKKLFYYYDLSFIFWMFIGCFWTFVCCVLYVDCAKWSNGYFNCWKVWKTNFFWIFFFSDFFNRFQSFNFLSTTKTFIHHFSYIISYIHFSFFSISSFFWLLAIMLTAIIWYIITPMHQVHVATVLLSVIIQEFFRFVFYMLYV